MLSSTPLRKWFVSSPFQSKFSVYLGLASMEKTVDHLNISVDELECDLVSVFHCKHGEEKESERERDRKKETERERHKSRQKETERKERERNKEE